jgi:hypothetical protein
MSGEHKFLCMVGQLALWKYGRGYALYEKGELIAVFMYRKGALRVAELFAQVWPTRFGNTNYSFFSIVSSPSAARASSPAVRPPSD